MTLDFFVANSSEPRDVVSTSTMNTSHNSSSSPQLEAVHSPDSSEATGVASSNGVIWVTSLLSVTLMIMCALGVAGNIYTLVITRSAAMRRTGSMYVYIINLALADLIYLSTIPFVVCTYLAHDWLFGEAGCHILLSLDLLTMHASVFILVAMSLERYRAVARPFSAHRSSSRRRKLVAGVIWGLSFVLTLPMMVMIRLRVSKLTADGLVKRICLPTWTSGTFKFYITLLFFTGVFIPGLVIIGLYFGLSRHYWATQARLGKSGHRRAQRRGLKQKVISMIFSIVVAYWTCFLPFWGWQLAKLFSPETLNTLSPAAHNYVNFFVTCLTYGNSCINPLLYTFLTRNYKEYLAHKSHSLGMSRVEPVSVETTPHKELE